MLVSTRDHLRTVSKIIHRERHIDLLGVWVCIAYAKLATIICTTYENRAINVYEGSVVEA